MTNSISNFYYINSPLLFPIAITCATALTINKLAGYVESKLQLRPSFSEAPIKRKIAAFCLTGLVTIAVSAAGTGLGISSLPGTLTITALATSICALKILYPLIQFKTFQLLSALKIKSAAYRLGTLYEAGIGVAKDPAKAQEIYKKAADWGHRDAQYRVGMHTKNDHYLMLAHKQGNTLASYELGLKYSKVKNKKEEAFNCFKKAADGGHMESQYRVGAMLLKKNEPSQAFVYLSRASNQGHTQARYMAALCYLDGYGITRNADKGIEMLKLLGDQKHSSALHELGICYLEGNPVKQDVKKAFAYLLQAAELKHPEALCELGILYQDGIHFKEDQNKAFAYFKEAADKDLPRGHYLVGLCYENGYSVSKDLVQALAHYQKAADKKYAEAEYSIATLSHDDVEAFNYYKRAAKRGLAKAQFELAICYFEGKGRDISRPKALRYLKEAAEQGHVQAQARLGDEYSSGMNLKKNLQLAVEYYTLAADKGDGHSQERLVELNTAS